MIDRQIKQQIDDRQIIDRTGSSDCGDWQDKIQKAGRWLIDQKLRQGRNSLEAEWLFLEISVVALKVFSCFDDAHLHYQG